jgi:hypothetical protein
MPNLLHFLPELGALYALRSAPSFYEIHPRETMQKVERKAQIQDIK